MTEKEILSELKELNRQLRDLKFIVYYLKKIDDRAVKKEKVE